MADPRPTEAQCQRTIIDAAKITGWLVMHTRPARTTQGFRTPIEGHAGFPDLVLVHPDHHRLLFIELKRKPYKVSPDQQRWLDALHAIAVRSVGIQARVVWVPEEMDDLLHLLTNPGGSS